MSLTKHYRQRPSIPLSPYLDAPSFGSCLTFDVRQIKTMSNQPNSLTEIEEKRILAELELQRMAARREQVRKRIENRVAFGLYLSAIILYTGLFYWEQKSGSPAAFIVLIATCPILTILLGMFTKLCSDTSFIKRHIESRNEKRSLTKR